MKKLSRAEIQRARDARAAYERTEPKQFGNLHARFKYLLALAQEPGCDKIGNDLWHAIWDLKTEVESHTPDEPPHGRRPANIN